MNWKVDYLPEALEDLRKLDGSQKILIRKAIQKVSQNPKAAMVNPWETETVQTCPDF